MMNKPAGARGRRPGRQETRQQILDAARTRFLAEGYQKVTLRAIAADAGVDVALLSYYFGSKKGLFGAALALPANPPEVLADVLPGDPATLPERVLRAVLTTWNEPEQADPLRVMLAAAVHDPEVARLVREVLEREVIGRIAEHIGGVRASYRAGAFAAQLAGVILTRYVLRLEPVGSMTVDELTRHLAPGLRAVLYGPGPRHRPPGTPPTMSA